MRKVWAPGYARELGAYYDLVARGEVRENLSGEWLDSLNSSVDGRSIAACGRIVRKVQQSNAQVRLDEKWGSG